MKPLYSYDEIFDLIQAICSIDGLLILNEVILDDHENYTEEESIVMARRLNSKIRFVEKNF